MTLTSFILWIYASIFSSRNGFLEIFNIENVQKYMLKLLKWIKVACIMIPKQISGPKMFKWILKDISVRYTPKIVFAQFIISCYSIDIWRQNNPAMKKTFYEL